MEKGLVRPVSQSIRCSSRVHPQKSSTRSLLRPRYKSTSSASKANTKASSEELLSWPDYLAIRKSRRKWQNAMTIPTSGLGLIGGASYFGGLETDPTKPIFGIDPFFFYGICTAACMGAGYLVGPSLGNAIWRYSHRRFGNLIDTRDREFYQHISKNRVDPSLQSPTSPVPDYYGEKIGSLHQYRQWLRDQNKYRRKVTLPED